jgi:hypothetical protein
LSFSSTNSSVKGICFKFCFARSLKTNDRGIYPDYMHIVHLALGVDCMSSVLLDLTDDGMNLIAGPTRAQRLKHVWDSYREWCEGTSGFGCIFFKPMTMAENAKKRPLSVFGPTCVFCKRG